jgi:hypothetical protein
VESKFAAKTPNQSYIINFETQQKSRYLVPQKLTLRHAFEIRKNRFLTRASSPPNNSPVNRSPNGIMKGFLICFRVITKKEGGKSEKKHQGD